MKYSYTFHKDSIFFNSQNGYSLKILNLKNFQIKIDVIFLHEKIWQNVAKDGHITQWNKPIIITKLGKLNKP